MFPASGLACYSKYPTLGQEKESEIVSVWFYRGNDQECRDGTVGCFDLAIISDLEPGVSPVTL